MSLSHAQSSMIFAVSALIQITGILSPLTEDREIVEMGQDAYDKQGADWNEEIFPPVRDLRTLLVANGEALK